MKRTQTPIVHALKEYVTKGTIRFHMPGHKGNQMQGNPLTDFLGPDVFKADVTNIPGMDDLHQPQGIIKKSQKMAALTFGAKCTYFLVNGSSCGLEALIMSVCKPGEKIIVPRNIHRSILSGIILSGAIPIFFMPEYEQTYGIFTGTPPETIVKVLEANPEAKGIVLVNPTYNGVISNVQTIADIAHAKGIPLLVDEAHGPHFTFHKDLPASALACGADATVHGSHKMLSAFTQASMLHIKGDRIDIPRLENSLRLLQSTSTSYLLLASLEATRVQMESQGKELLDHAIQLSTYLQREINAMGLPTYKGESAGKEPYVVEPCKITVLLNELNMNGPWVENWLREERNIQVELSAPNNILLLVTPGNRQHDADILLQALQEMTHLAKASLPTLARKTRDCILPPYVPQAVVSPRKAFFADAKIISLDNAVDKICAETISCYPPGIPVICPGEKFTKDIVQYLQAVKFMGVHFQGCLDHQLDTVQIIAQ